MASPKSTFSLVVVEDTRAEHSIDYGRASAVLESVLGELSDDVPVIRYELYHDEDMRDAETILLVIVRKDRDWGRFVISGDTLPGEVIRWIMGVQITDESCLARPEQFGPTLDEAVDALRRIQAVAQERAESRLSLASDSASRCMNENGAIDSVEAAARAICLQAEMLAWYEAAEIAWSEADEMNVAAPGAFTSRWDQMGPLGSHEEKARKALVEALRKKFRTSRVIDRSSDPALASARASMEAWIEARKAVAPADEDEA